MSDITVERQFVFYDEIDTSYRWRLQENADIPGCVDLLYEVYDEDTKRWESKHLIECMEPELLSRIGKLSLEI